MKAKGRRAIRLACLEQYHGQRKKDEEKSASKEHKAQRKDQRSWSGRLLIRVSNLTDKARQRAAALVFKAIKLIRN